jgi:predicted dehydrogenase
MKPSRRRFLRIAATTALGPMIVRPSLVCRAADGTPPPSERITLGFIGVGKQATGHLTAFVRRKDVAVLGVCDVQEIRRKLAKEIVDKATAGALPKPENPDANANGDNPSAGSSAALATGGAVGTPANSTQYYNDLRDLLARKEIDAVVIATPDHWHATAAVLACRAGKDIYCEKPLTLTLGESRQVIDAARRYARVFQVGSQQRSSRDFRFACEMVRSGRIGKLKTVAVNVGGPPGECDLPAEPVRAGVDWDMWLGPIPWRPFNNIICPPPDAPDWPRWRNYREFCNGQLADMGAHHFDIAQWAMGMDDTGPVELLPPAGLKRLYLTMRYANGVELYHTNIGASITFRGSAGTIEVGRGYLRSDPPAIMKTPTTPNEVHLYQSPGHHEDWIRAIRARRDPICPPEIGARSAAICQLTNICYWLNRPLKWDPAKEQFIDDAEANRWLDRPKRAPWIL